MLLDCNAFCVLKLGSFKMAKQVLRFFDIVDPQIDEANVRFRHPYVRRAVLAATHIGSYAYRQLRNTPHGSAHT